MLAEMENLTHEEAVAVKELLTKMRAEKEMERKIHDTDVTLRRLVNVAIKDIGLAETKIILRAIRNDLRTSLAEDGI